VLKVAAVLAGAFIDDPVLKWLVPGSLRVASRLRTTFATEIEQYLVPNGGTVWTTSTYDDAVSELPPGAWEMPKPATGTETLTRVRAFATRLPRAIRVRRVVEERHLREPASTSEPAGCAPLCRDRAWDRRACARRSTEPNPLDYRHTSKPAASAARKCISG
jgi:hypothetical protein